jgi:asparaginyl-tRNA synthetase
MYRFLTCRISDALHGDTIGKEVKVQGWLRSIRQQKSTTFLNINDGSCLTNIQAIIDGVEKHDVEKMDVGASVEVTGTMVQSPGAKQKTELLCKDINAVTVVGRSPKDYPLQKKFHTNEYLREIAHLRPRANQTAAVLRIRNVCMNAVHSYFQKNGFICVHTPIISGVDCEGAGEQFNVSSAKEPDFFGKQAYLTVSGQLEAEIFANSMGNVYTFGPTFRAEAGKSSRHLSEFWMIEMEKTFCDLSEDMQHIEGLIKHVVKTVLDSCQEDLQLFQQFVDPTTMDRLENVVKSSFPIISYTEAIEILLKSGKKFEFPLFWGCDLSSEHEIYLCKEYTKKPTFVINYPKSLKPFYARVNDDGKTVACVDMFVSNVGELVGGSQREDRYDVLKQAMIDKKVDVQQNDWYLDLRKYGTTVHSGFGVGFERLIMMITGLHNIRDVIPIPRHPGYIKF